ncbi:MAG TPA: M1 family aminopeptidase [Bryobacteraceae bacterium]|nr:M1 family aminopeptidase [Bryobacteraceae bacterium]
MAQFSSARLTEGVSRELARDRAQVVSNIRYQLNLALSPHAPRMPGHAVIQFDLTSIPDPLVIDYRDLDARGHTIDGAVKNLRVNGTAAELRQRLGHLLIPGSALHRGANKIELDFESPIAEANRAITRFVDTNDNNEYIYTLFVPMDASLAFPCFDQPDLKARFKLSVTKPAEWKVISNGRALSGDGFEETKPISTYLFAFAAGPFESLDSSNLHLFVRKSMLARAKEEWPSVAATVSKGMTLMSAFFAQPFPFPKYDQVLIPGFPYGGMEHAGATFFNEDTILFRTVPTVNDYNRRNETVLHELAHQWFGDLVTMRWFDDLWLKEGFAQYMAYHTLAQMEPASSGGSAAVWKRFYQSIKPLAYGIDATHGTTPIYQQIANLKDAKSAYGAIVYQKAPSLLRVLAYNIGEDHFRDGVRIFLREHAYANAEWNDLIAAFSRASGTALQPWADSWVKQRGMPQVEIVWACDSSHLISSFHVTQKDALDEGHLWPLRTQVLLGYKGRAPVRVEAALDGASASVPSAMGKACPDYVFGNDEDHAYGEFLLDPKSQTAIIRELPEMTDPFLRALLWGALWDSVRELRMAPSEYLDLSLRLLPAERDAELAVSVLGRTRDAFTDYLSGTQRTAVAERFENLLIREFAAAPTPDLRITYFRGLLAVATTPHARDTLKELLAGRTTIPGVPLKQRDRWNIIGALVAAGDASAAELLAGESRHDTSDDGRKYAYVTGAAFAQPENKKKYFAGYLASSGVKEDWVTASLPLFNRWNQTAVTSAYLQPALDALPQLKRERKIFFVVNWLSSFVGNQNSPAALLSVDAFLKQNAPDPDLRLKILEVRDELDRTVKIRARWAK